MAKVYDYKKTIVELLRKRGKADKEILVQGVCNILGIDLEDYNSKSFYRHMKELVENGELQCEESGTPKRKYWYVAGEENKQIPNGSLIEAHNALLYVPAPTQTFLSNFSVKTGALDHDDHDMIYIYFNLNHDFFCLRAHRDAVPFKIHLARITDEAKSSVVSKVAEAHGNRCIALHLPVSKLSSMKECGESGHALLEFDMDELVVTDLKSSNGSGLSTISHAQAQKIIKDGDLIGKCTVSEEWLTSGIGGLKFSKISGGDVARLSYPLVAEFSSDFKVLVYLPSN